MLETNVYEYFAFGYNYHILRLGTLGSRVKGDEHALAESIDQFFEHLDSLNLQVTSHAASNLRDIRSRLESMPENAHVDKELADEMRAACDQIDVTLDSELQLRLAFIALPGRFTTEQLLEEPENLLGSETFEQLPEIALFDFFEACRAVALGMATAAVFHIMRCVEAMLREYYQAIIRQNRVKSLMWYPMVQHLRKRKRNPPPQTILDHLDHIRIVGVGGIPRSGNGRVLAD